jgi:hypothetical protein
MTTGITSLMTTGTTSLTKAAIIDPIGIVVIPGAATEIKADSVVAGDGAGTGIDAAETVTPSP